MIAEEYGNTMERHVAWIRRVESSGGELRFRSQVSCPMHLHHSRSSIGSKVIVGGDLEVCECDSAVFVVGTPPTQVAPFTEALGTESVGSDENMDGGGDCVIRNYASRPRR